jgi:hypothetical protein
MSSELSMSSEELKKLPFYGHMTDRGFCIFGDKIGDLYNKSIYGKLASNYYKLRLIEMLSILSYIPPDFDNQIKIVVNEINNTYPHSILKEFSNTQPNTFSVDLSVLISEYTGVNPENINKLPLILFTNEEIKNIQVLLESNSECINYNIIIPNNIIYDSIMQHYEPYLNNFENPILDVKLNSMTLKDSVLTKNLVKLKYLVVLNKLDKEALIQLLYNVMQQNNLIK